MKFQYLNFFRLIFLTLDAVKYIENIALNTVRSLNYGHMKSPQTQYKESIKK